MTHLLPISCPAGPALHAVDLRACGASGRADGARRALLRRIGNLRPCFCGFLPKTPPGLAGSGA